MHKIFKHFTATSGDPVSQFNAWYASLSLTRQNEVDASVTFIEGSDNVGVALYTHGKIYYTVMNGLNVKGWYEDIVATSTDANGVVTWTITPPFTTPDLTVKLYELVSGAYHEISADVSVDASTGVTTVTLNPGIGASTSVAAGTYRAVCTLSL